MYYGIYQGRLNFSDAEKYGNHSVNSNGRYMKHKSGTWHPKHSEYDRDLLIPCFRKYN